MVNLLEESLTWTNFFVFLFWGIVMLMLVLGFVTYAIYFERKVIGMDADADWTEPNGAFGLLQSVADVSSF